MIGDVLAYAANRATSGAVESISKRAVWFVAGGLVLLLGCFFAVLAAFWTLEPLYGPIQSAGFIAGACLILALVCFVVPAVSQYFQKRRARIAAKTADPVAETIKAVNVETTEAVDYFGPLQVVASAFTLGMGVARQIKGTAA
jgi:hypothetical protein